MQRLAENVRKLRQGHHWSQRELSRQAHVSQPVISSIEAGTAKRTSAEVLARLSRALGVTLDALTEGEFPEPEDHPVLVGLFRLMRVDRLPDLARKFLIDDTRQWFAKRTPRQIRQLEAQLRPAGVLDTDGPAEVVVIEGGKTPTVLPPAIRYGQDKQAGTVG